MKKGVERHTHRLWLSLSSFLPLSIISLPSFPYTSLYTHAINRERESTTHHDGPVGLDPGVGHGHEALARRLDVGGTDLLDVALDADVQQHHRLLLRAQGLESGLRGNALDLGPLGPGGEEGGAGGDGEESDEAAGEEGGVVAQRGEGIGCW
jgi:hypothetical protein